MTSTTISVIIPVFNSEAYLRQTIESVLDQTRPPDEVLLVDDGSMDQSAAIAQSFVPEVRYLRQKNGGPASARNYGIQNARCDVLAFLDADDLWLPDKLALQIHELEKDSSCDAVLGRVENFISPELNQEQQLRLAHAAVQSGDVHVGVLLIRKQAFMQIGPFNPRWRQSDFVDWWGRALQSGLHYQTRPELMLRRRLHLNNLTRIEREQRAEYLFMLREQLLQKRNQSRGDMQGFVEGL